MKGKAKAMTSTERSRKRRSSLYKNIIAHEKVKEIDRNRKNIINGAAALNRNKDVRISLCCTSDI